jgi:hypothetical protein
MTPLVDVSALNFRFSGDRTKARAGARRMRALEMLEVVRIPSARRRLDSYPHEMSGGMRQRAMMALALACRPKILLVLLLRELQREFGISCSFAPRCSVAEARCFDPSRPTWSWLAPEARDVSWWSVQLPRNGLNAAVGFRGYRLCPGASHLKMTWSRQPIMARFPDGAGRTSRINRGELSCIFQASI